MNSKIKFISITSAIALSLSSAAALANENDIMLISEDNAAVNISETVASELKITIDGAETEKTAKYFGENLMLPLRNICESLGMEVLWDGENEMITISKLPVYITCTPNADGYTFAKTAPVMLGTAPVLENGTTYVPFNFVSDILNVYAEVDNGGVAITTTPVAEPEINSEEAAAPAGTALVNTIGENQINIYDFERGEVEVNITEETVIADSEGNALKLEDLTVGMLVEIEYADIMTTSLPPITNAVKITVKTQELCELVSGTVSASDASEQGVSLTLGEDIQTQLVLNLSDDTVIFDAEGNAAKADTIVKGTKITAVASIAATRSLPPQRSAYFIRIEQ